MKLSFCCREKVHNRTWPNHVCMCSCKGRNKYQNLTFDLHEYGCAVYGVFVKWQHPLPLLVTTLASASVLHEQSFLVLRSLQKLKEENKVSIMADSYFHLITILCSLAMLWFIADINAKMQPHVVLPNYFSLIFGTKSLCSNFTWIGKI